MRRLLVQVNGKVCRCLRRNPRGVCVVPNAECPFVLCRQQQHMVTLHHVAGIGAVVRAACPLDFVNAVKAIRQLPQVVGKKTAQRLSFCGGFSLFLCNCQQLLPVSPVGSQKHQCLIGGGRHTIKVCRIVAVLRQSHPVQAVHLPQARFL